MKKGEIRRLGKRALSPIFATLILVAIVFIFGSLAYYYSSNLTTTATNNYVSSASTSQQSEGERLALENFAYTQSSPATLTVYVLNCGISNNLQINGLILYNASDTTHTPLATYSNTQFISPGMVDLNTGKTITCLNAGQEGYFTVSLTTSHGSVPNLKGSICEIQITTKSGSSFNYEFAP